MPFGSKKFKELYLENLSQRIASPMTPPIPNNDNAISMSFVFSLSNYTILHMPKCYLSL